MTKYLLIAALLFAQAPQQPKPNDKQQAIVKEAEPLQKQLADVTKELESNDKFQRYLYLQGRLQQLQQEYNEAQTKPEVKPEVKK